MATSNFAIQEIQQLFFAILKKTYYQVVLNFTLY